VQPLRLLLLLLLPLLLLLRRTPWRPRECAKARRRPHSKGGGQLHGRLLGFDRDGGLQHVSGPTAVPHAEAQRAGAEGCGREGEERLGVGAGGAGHMWDWQCQWWRPRFWWRRGMGAGGAGQVWEAVPMVATEIGSIWEKGQVVRGTCVIGSANGGSQERQRLL